jgi:lipoyl(octanoyl) transferase
MRLSVLRLRGLVDYVAALEWQRGLARARADGAIEDDLLILLEHPHVITLGRGARDGNVVTPSPRLDELGVTVHEVERGGDVTYHGPGQLVGYPILDLTEHRKDLHWYLRRVEAALIRALEPFGVEGRRVEGYTGVWVEDRKIASIGVHVGRWVTWHGFALNVSTELDYFDLIVPCGIPAVRMTSIAGETGKPASIDDAALEAARTFGEAFGLEPRWAGSDEIRAPGVPAAPAPVIFPDERLARTHPAS